MRYGKHPFYLSPREAQDDTLDLRLADGERVDPRGAEAIAREYVWRAPSNPKED